MNKLILLTFLLLASISYSQDYDAKIQELNQQLATAISNEDFEKASSTKQERDFYIELKEAIANEDFERASQIKKQLAGEKITEELKSTSTNDDCIIYFFAGNQVGPIGGSISMTNYDAVRLTYRQIKKITVKPGKITFKTNVTETQDILTRTLIGGNIYFIEFNSYVGNALERPTLRFVDQPSFIKLSDFSEKFPENYSFADNGILPNENKLRFSVNYNCSNCHLEVNGTRIISGLKKKTIYSIGIPKNEIVVTFIKKMAADYTAPLCFNSLTIYSKDNPCLEADFKAMGFGTLEVKLSQPKLEEFLSKKQKFELVEVNN